MQRILLIDKPKGITSAKAVERVKRALKVKKAGHAGTLDPLATGLLIIGLDEGTKQLTEYLKLPKTYEAEILVGESRTTGDMEGEVVEERRVEDLSEELARRALENMVGTLELPVSAYSALKRDGEPLYKKARRGENVPLPVRKMDVRSAEFLGFAVEGQRAVVKARFDVGSGTYIRSLAEELGRRLGYPATLRELRRTCIGEFRIEDTRTLEELGK